MGTTSNCITPLYPSNHEGGRVLVMRDKRGRMCDECMHLISMRLMDLSHFKYIKIFIQEDE